MGKFETSRALDIVCHKPSWLTSGLHQTLELRQRDLIFPCELRTIYTPACENACTTGYLPHS